MPRTERSGLHASPAGGNVPLSGLVAIVGCDGTGKSSLTTDLVAHFSIMGPTERRYLGLVSGEVGEKLRRFPFIGGKLEPHLARKAALAQDMQRQVPGLKTALVMYLLSWWRAVHFWYAHRRSRRGTLVITDRYPQAQVPGFRYDGPGLGTRRSDNRLIRWLALHEQRLYQRMERLQPNLVVRLGIDVETARQRKPDHAPAELHDKIATMACLHYAGAPLVEIDTRRNYSEVLHELVDVIEAALLPSPSDHHS
ncbi:MAG: hypothetical protein ABIU96_06000 [Rhodanobacter sp.]